MAHRKLASCRLSRAMAVAMTAAALVINVAHAQTGIPRGPKLVTDPSLRRISGTGDDHGPSKFADLAEKVTPAVIGVVSKSAPARGTLQDQSPEFGQPLNQDDEDTPKGTVPMPGLPDQPKGPKAELMTIGSGFFISPDGYAVTNSHVVEDSAAAEVRTSDDKTYTAKVVGRDPLSDLALIKVDGRTDFTYVKIADQPPRIGDWVLTAGNTFGLGGTVTAGIVSARERELEAASTEDFLQIDAPINQGDSGGPSFNTSGEVVGVNSMIFSPTGGSVGVAFAIPADIVRTVIPQLKDKGAVVRGSIGAEVQSVTPDIASSLGADDVRGAIVARVQNNGPAAKAGLKSGDVITSLNGDPIKNAHELTKKIHAMAPGKSVRLAMLRNEKENSLSITLSQLPNQPSAPANRPR